MLIDAARTPPFVPPRAATAGGAGFTAETLGRSAPMVQAVARYEQGQQILDRLYLGAKEAADLGKSVKLAADRARLQVLKFDALAAAASGDAKKAKAIAQEVAGIAKELGGLGDGGGGGVSDGTTADGTVSDTVALDGTASASDPGQANVTQPSMQVSGSAGGDSFQQELADALGLAHKIIDFLRRAFAGRRLAGQDLARLVGEFGDSPSPSSIASPSPVPSSPVPSSPAPSSAFQGGRLDVTA